MKDHHHKRSSKPKGGVVAEPGPRPFDLQLPSNEKEEDGGGYARRRKPEEHPQVPLLDLPNRGG